jgi:hypothetical protein
MLLGDIVKTTIDKSKVNLKDVNWGNPCLTLDTPNPNVTSIVCNSPETYFGENGCPVGN